MMTEWQRAIVSVTAEGRGFVVEGRYGDRYVVTAAHCLPYLPPPGMNTGSDERTFNIVGPLGGGEFVAAQCRFADPICDIAVLGTPDEQLAPVAADAYNELVAGAAALLIGDLPSPTGGWIFNLENVWEPCWLSRHGLSVSASSTSSRGVSGGMSGSPLLTSRGEAVGVIGCGEVLNAAAALCLPTWLRDELMAPRLAGKAEWEVD